MRIPTTVAHIYIVFVNIHENRVNGSSIGTKNKILERNLATNNNDDNFDQLKSLCRKVIKRDKFSKSRER